MLRKKQQFKCTVCNERKTSIGFPLSQLRNKKETAQNEHLRCTACHTCKRCGQEKQARAFEKVSNTCTECDTQGKEKLQCTVCRKHIARDAFPWQEMKNKEDPAQDTHLRCKACHTCKKCGTEKHILAFESVSKTCTQCDTKEPQKLKCTVCECIRTRDAFPWSQVRHKGDTGRNKTLRCTECYTCRKCGTEKHILAFKGISTTCIACDAKGTQKIKCTVCQRIIARDAFPQSQVSYTGDTTRSKHLRCTECHTCKECGTERHSNAFKGASNTCMRCSPYFCNACNTHKPRNAFDANIFKNAKTKITTLVCLACNANGMSPTNVKKYRCSECGEQEHSRFAVKDRREYLTSNGRCSMVCLDCYAKQKQIMKVLRNKKAWRRTCPGTGWTRPHLMSNVSCPLFGMQMEERRWPGKNVEVLEEEWNFVLRMLKRRSK